MIRRTSLSASIFLGLTLVFSGCGDGSGASDGRIPISIFLLLLSSEQTEYYRWAERTYEAEHPEVDIVFEQFPGTSLKDFEIKLRLRFRSRQSPDIFYFRENALAEFKRNGLLAPAPDYIVKMIEENSLNDLVRTASYYDDGYYGIVHDADWTALYYNKDMFEEAGLDPNRPPETWEQMLDYAEKLTVRRPDGSLSRAGISLRKTGYKPGTAEKWLTFFYSAGGIDYNQQGTEAYFDSPAGHRAIDLYETILLDRKLDSVNLESDQQAFGQGLAAMFIREIHVVRWLREHHPNVNFGVGPIPRNVESLSGGGSYPMVVSNDSEHKEEAWRFVEWLMQDEPYAKYVRMTNVLPCTKSVAEMPEFGDDPYLRVFLEQPVYPPRKFPRIGRANDILGAYIERFCYGMIGAAEMLERANEEINALLERNERGT